MHRACSLLLASSGVLLAAASLRADLPITVTVTPAGPSPAALEAAKEAATRSAPVQRYLRGASFRLLRFSVSEPDGGRPGAAIGGVWFDYTHNRAIAAEGTLAGGITRAAISPVQPLPSREEFDAAVGYLRDDPNFAEAIQKGRLRPLPAMPPLVGLSEPAGAVDRVLTVDLLPQDADASFPHEIVGVDMIRHSVVRYAGGAPPQSSAAPDTCGYPQLGGGQFYAGNEVELSVYQGPNVIWDFTVVRPLASSATNGSGVELRNVMYKGKLVFNRAHVPILNVLYTSSCGPYRDWLTSEDGFMATATQVSGFWDATARPQTIVEDHTDLGNVIGVAYYIKGTSLYLVSECNAGWYRYVMEWQLDADGTIHPRFGFSAVTSSCVCIIHTHHAYWRFDFNLNPDPITGPNEIVTEETRSGSTTLTTEVKKRRTAEGPIAGKTWLIQNPATGDAYRIIPGQHDGTADSFGQGDLWFLQYHQDGSGNPLELDDYPNIHFDDSANLDQYLNSESIQNKDVVVWYAGHFVHNANDTNSETGDVLIGPDIVPVSW